MPRRKDFPSDVVISSTVKCCKSLEEAAERLGLSKTCVRKHAVRLNVTTRFLYGVERLPQDGILKGLLLDAGRGKGLSRLSRYLGVTCTLLREECKRLGVEGRFPVRAGLPDDATLIRDLTSCVRLSDLAKTYGVAEHTVRNQCKRLKIPVPSKRRTVPARRGKGTATAHSPA